MQYMKCRWQSSQLRLHDMGKKVSPIHDWLLWIRARKQIRQIEFIHRFLFQIVYLKYLFFGGLKGNRRSMREAV